jgi:penicillin-insensitive murein endopeptidase
MAAVIAARRTERMTLPFGFLSHSTDATERIRFNQSIASVRAIVSILYVNTLREGMMQNQTFRRSVSLAVAALLLAYGAAAAQDRGTVEPKILPPLANPDAPTTPAKELFGRKTTPAPMQARTIGFYANGCLAGGVALPINGPAWQVMRLSRNRNWGHPALIRTLEKLAEKARPAGWSGLLVGDLSQPRGGPMLTGHSSHQIGLDADIWLTPMPDRELTLEEREYMSATMVVAADRRDVNPAVWIPGHVGVIRTAAQMPEVERIFVNAAIKKALCRDNGGDRAWHNKVRPYWGHDYHFHIRIRCPGDSPDCKPQPPVPPGDGCGKDLDWWFQDSVLRPPPPTTTPKSRPPLTMAALPPACRIVLQAP